MVQCRRGGPSTLKPDIEDGADTRGRTIHVGSLYHGRFGVKSGTVHAGGMNRGWCGYQGSNHPRWESISRKVRGQERNLPRWGPISRMVQISGSEPSAVEVDFMEGSGSRAEPSTLRANIADGSNTRGRTVHTEGMNRGWCGYQGLNHPRWESISRKVRGPKRNLPRWGPESRKVRVSGSEPSAVEVDFTEGSGSRAEPSTLRANIADGPDIRG